MVYALIVSQEMKDRTINPKRKWWNNGWIGLSILLAVYIALFVTGRNSLTTQTQPNPLVEGRQLSEWIDELPSYDLLLYGEDIRAAEVLRRHQPELSPILVRWLDTRDTFPQLVYFFTMSRYRGNPTYYLQDDLGVYPWQLRAAKAARALRVQDPVLAAALERNLEHYRVQHDFKKGKNNLATLVEKALQIQN